MMRKLLAICIITMLVIEAVSSAPTSKENPKDKYEVNKEDGTDEWMTKFCKENNCEEQEGDMILTNEQVEIENEDKKNYQNPHGR